MADVTVTINAVTTDNNIYSFSNATPLSEAYTQAREGTGLATPAAANGGLGDDTSLRAGQAWGISDFQIDPGAYYIYEAFTGFDTSTIPASAVIKQVKLVLYGGKSLPVQEVIIEARLYDWGTTVTAADWVKGSQLSSKPLLAIADTSTFKNSPVTNFVSTPEFITNINRSGVTRMILVSQEQTLGIAPTYLNSDIEERFRPGSGASNKPQLVITYEVPSTTTGIKKEYLYKVFDSAGNYLTTWTDVATEPNISRELNGAGSQLAIKLARSADPLTSDVEFGNQVQVYCIDQEQPNGKLIFTGKISQYTPSFDAAESIDITMVSYGADLGAMIMEGEVDATGSINIQPVVGQVDALTATNQWRAERFLLAEDPRRITVYTDTQYGFSGGVYTDVAGAPGTVLLPIVFQAGILSGGFYQLTYEFPDNHGLTVGSYYHLVVQGTAVTVDLARLTTNPYADGYYLTSSNSGGTWTSVPGSDMCMTLVAHQVTTTFSYTGTDPVLIMQDVLERYRALGGLVTYNASSINPTNTSVDYTFKVATFLEAVNKVAELCPTGWYWFVDPADNVLYLRDSTDLPDHRFGFGMEITKLQPIRIDENIINTIYFTGGDTGSGTNFYKKYTSTESIAIYGIRAVVVSDSRVTAEATADTIAAKILGNNGVATLKTTIEIVDNSLTSSPVGYDLESVQMGQIIGFSNSGAYNSSLWDEAQWDVAYWDYNLRQLATLRMQIVRMTYTPSLLQIECASVPIDVTKIIAENTRNIKDVNTLDNPVTPET